MEILNLRQTKQEGIIWYQNHHAIKVFSENLLGHRNKKTTTQVFSNRPVSLGPSISEISKIVMYEFWYHYVKPEYGEKANLCYLDTDSFIVHIKTEDICVDLTKNVETRFDTSNYELERPKGKNKKLIKLMKDKLGGKTITDFTTLRPNYIALSQMIMNENKNAKGTKKCVIKRNLNLKIINIV